MSAIDRVRRARSVLLGAVAVAALLWAAVLAVGVVGLVALGDLATPLPLALRRLALPGVAAGAAAAAVVVSWRGRHARTPGRVALYIEEHVPALQYALASAIEAAGAPGAPALEREVDRVDPRGVLRAPLARALAIPAAALALALLALAALPRATLERVLRPRTGDALLRPSPRAPLASRLSPIAVRVDPPPYARLPARTADDPTSLVALAGSRLEVRGRGATDGASDSVGAWLGRERLPVVVVGDTWSVSLRMPQQPAVVHLVDRGFQRLVTLEPEIDAAPVVTLVAPTHDTTYREPKGRITLVADAKDDIGLARAEFELVHTAGSGERFTTRRLAIGALAPAGARATRLHATVSLDTLHLGPGDVLHVRAVAWDENNVTGPDTGSSDTRTIRIADPRDRDTLNLNATSGAALDTTILSQRMLILRAETLLIRRHRIPVDSFTRSSVRLGVAQGRVRGGVESILADLQIESGAGYVGRTEVSTLLHDAASAMLDAETELRVVQVRDALPHMYRALDLLEQSRSARRLYLRGLRPKVVVDIDRVRLKGTDNASVAARLRRAPFGDVRRALLERIDRALRLLARAPAAAVDSLTLIRVDALTQAPDAAEALGRAVGALRDGRDPTPSLLQARRRLERAAEGEPMLSAWQGMR